MHDVQFTKAGSTANVEGSSAWMPNPRSVPVACFPLASELTGRMRAVHANGSVSDLPEVPFSGRYLRRTIDEWKIRRSNGCVPMKTGRIQ